jgi:phospholipase C
MELQLSPRTVGLMRRLLAMLAVTTLAACGQSNSLPLPQAQALAQGDSGSSPIQHLVIIIQENRSFDNLFDCIKGTDCVKRGKEEVKTGTTYVDKWVKLSEQLLVPKSDNNDIGHCYRSFTTAYDGGKMDGFNLEPKGVCPPKTSSPYKPVDTFPYQYINRTEIAPYWDMAEQYALADRMFQTQGSGSFTAHQDLIRGGSALGGAYGSSPSLIDTPTGTPWGCDGPLGEKTDLITTSLTYELYKGPRPCTKDFTYSGYSKYTTLRDLLDAAGISWHYYAACYEDADVPSCKGTKSNSGPGAEINAFDVIYPVRYGSEWGTNVSMPQTNILKDIKKNQLAAVSWVTPDQNDSDHPGDTVDHGPQWVASIVNAIGESSYWNSTAIVVLWDDWGGMYDHVKPPAVVTTGTGRDDQGGLGFRVPMIVISPYVPEGVVSHTQYEFGSIVKYVEGNWGLPSLGTTDQRATSIVNIFNYSQNPRSFTPIKSGLSAEYFEHETPSLFPADDE